MMACVPGGQVPAGHVPGYQVIPQIPLLPTNTSIIGDTYQPKTSLRPDNTNVVGNEIMDNNDELQTLKIRVFSAENPNSD